MSLYRPLLRFSAKKYPNHRNQIRFRWRPPPSAGDPLAMPNLGEPSEILEATQPGVEFFEILLLLYSTMETYLPTYHCLQYLPLPSIAYLPLLACLPAYLSTSFNTQRISSQQHSKFRGGHFTLNMPSICGLELLTMTFASLPLTFAVRCALGAA